MMKQHLLVVDDELGPREAMRAVFTPDFRVSLADSAPAALRILAQEKVDLVLMDVIMPGEDGLTLLRRVQDLYPEVPVVMASAATSVRPVVEAMRVGAFDYVTKPFDVEELRLIVRRAIENSNLRRRVQTLETDMAEQFPVEAIVGESPAFLRALDTIRKAADTDATVLIGGESGTGKELAARMLHALSPRAREPFVAVHCGALPESLMESELFGHEKGAFTNADKRKAGRFDLAGDGTLFFDEVSEMSLATQVKLLRVLQEREFMRVGGTQVIKTNARIVAASAKDLRHLATEGAFRDDLYYRLGVVPVSLPPLRERSGDVTRLAQHFLVELKRSIKAQTETFSPDAMACLEAYAWPGNVRELRNVVERMLVLHGQEPVIQADYLPEEFHVRTNDDPSPGLPADLGAMPLQDRIAAYEKQLIDKALDETNGVQTRAATLLGTTRRILRYRMEKLGLAPES